MELVGDSYFPTVGDIHFSAYITPPMPSTATGNKRFQQVISTQDRLQKAWNLWEHVYGRNYELTTKTMSALKETDKAFKQVKDLSCRTLPTTLCSLCGVRESQEWKSIIEVLFDKQDPCGCGNYEPLYFSRVPARTGRGSRYLRLASAPSECKGKSSQQHNAVANLVL